MDTKIEKKRTLQPKHIGIGLLVIILIAIFLYNSLGTPSTSSEVKKNEITITEVKRSNFNDYITINGVVKPITTVYLDAYENGRIVEKYIEEGSIVKKGDIILKLENRQLYEQILASENNLAIKQNNLRETKINFESQRVFNQKSLLEAEYRVIKANRSFEQNKSLFEEELIAKENYIRAKEEKELASKQYDVIKFKAKQDSLLSATGIKELDNDLIRMKKTLAMVYERIEHLNVRATLDGQLGMLDAEIGQSISQGQRIGQIHVLTNFKVQSNIDEHYIDRVTRHVSASLERDGETYALKTKKVYPEVRDGEFQIDLSFIKEKPNNIRTGQSYFIKLELGTPTNAILVSRGAFSNTTGGNWIYVVDASGNFATKRQIKIGKQNPQYYEILEGLEPNERVITSSYKNFENSDKLILN
ncbi:MAG: HlyD family efflux transporter periplasmic adaptor subunit [Flavobacteriaceae bacterium]|uniref:efflux RND transporter periplasmic adaptor subunit n=1 Tax=uncultured Polaribacter sp. TaxID=174711 RepID=UPI00260451F9|nr:HlyD family efflux transporter periplasmic adaptor subunit [uncultured Polaribacter sp.]